MSGLVFFFFQAEDGIRDYKVTGVQTCALPICGSNGFLFRDLRFQWFPILKWVVPMFFVKELKVPNIPYLEMGGSKFFFCLGTEGSKGSL